MRKRATAAAVVAALGMTAATPTAAQEPDSDRRTISVAGDASTVVPNDTARFSFGVRLRRATSGAALRATSARIRRVIASVRAQGVADTDIVTSTLSLGRVLVRRGSTRRVYEARNFVRVTVRRLPIAGQVVDAAVAAGATSVVGPVFAPGDVRAVYRQTLVAAFREAREKARQLAAEAGVTLGPTLSIREGGDLTPVPAAMLPPAPFERRRATPVRAGTTRIEARVSVVFAIS